MMEVDLLAGNHMAESLMKTRVQVEALEKEIHIATLMASSMHLPMPLPASSLLSCLLHSRSYSPFSNSLYSNSPFSISTTVKVLWLLKVQAWSWYLLWSNSKICALELWVHYIHLSLLHLPSSTSHSYTYTHICKHGIWQSLFMPLRS